MSRSKHTDPARIRAPRRVRAPHEPRGHADPGARDTIARALKELGIVLAAEPELREGHSSMPLPRLRVSRPRHGCHHPAGRADIVRVLRFFGESYTYGLHSIELLKGEGAPLDFSLGRLFVPGRIVLYDQPPSPWLLAGTLPEEEAARLRRAGAVCETAEDGFQTTIAWPGDTLREFMLFEVLMHEIGHHLIQQYKGKRPARVARTRDHEAFAHQFAARCRELWGDVGFQHAPPAVSHAREAQEPAAP
jgi:hypothetical protein